MLQILRWERIPGILQGLNDNPEEKKEVKLAIMYEKLISEACELLKTNNKLTVCFS